MASPAKAGYPSDQQDAAAASKKEPTAQVMARWEKDIGVCQESIRLMLNNRIAEADALLEESHVECQTREFDFEGGEHDLRGGFAFVGSIFQLLNGLASLEDNQLETVLTRVWAADELLAQDRDWAGKTVLRGLCILVAGVVQVMQGSYAKGVWNALRSWIYLRYLESEGLNFSGHERSCVRSTSLFGLGVFNLFVSMLPPTAMRSASWITGFSGGRDTSMSQLRMCFDEGGMCAPFAGLVLIGFAVDVSNFLGEFASQREVRLLEARRILDWAGENHPDSFFFEGQEANYLAAVRDLDGALVKIKHVGTCIEDKPAFVFLVHVRTATLRACKFEWTAAAEAYRAAVEIHRTVGRRAFCPTLLLNVHMCYVLAGDKEKEAAQALELCRSYRIEKKKWSNMDAEALASAELAHNVAEGKPEVNKEVWRPRLMFYLKLSVVYRGCNFMCDEDAKKFIAMLKAETEACGDDVDARCFGLMMQAESMRQLESWDEALPLVAEGTALAPQLSTKGKKLGSLHFLHLVAAFAHFSKGNFTAAQDALIKIDSLGTDTFFAKSVAFKATYLKERLGVEFKDTYRDVAIAARSKSRLLVDVGEDVETIEWDWVVKDKTITFRAVFTPYGDLPVDVQFLEKHEASSGPSELTYKVPGPGQLELLFDNSFSMMTGKSVQIRVQPDSLAVTEESNF